MYFNFFFRKLVLAVSFCYVCNATNVVAQNSASWEQQLTKSKALLIERPRDQSVYYQTIALYIEKSDYINVNKLYEKMLEFWPESANIYARWGSSLFQMQLYKEAAKKFIISIKYNREQADVHYNLGVTFYTLKNNEQALKAYQNACDLKPDNLQYQNAKAELLQLLGMNEEAMRIYQKTDMKPNVELFYNHAVGYYNAGDYKKALKNFQEALKIDPGHLESVYGLGLVYYSQNDYVRALQSFETVARINPKFNKVYYDIGVIHSQNAEYDKAFDAFIESVQGSQHAVSILESCDGILDYLQQENKKKYEQRKKLFQNVLRTRSEFELKELKQKYK